MIRGVLQLAISISALILPVLAHAEWSGKGEAGAALATANTGATTTTVSFKFDLASQVEQWKHAFGGSTLYTSSTAEATADAPDPTKQTTAKRWEAHEQSNYQFSERTFWFGGARHEHDDFGSFKYQSVLSTGFGYKVIDTEPTTLLTQLGVGYKRFKTNADDSADGEAIVTGLIDARHKLFATTVLLDKLSFESGSSNTFIQNDLALQVKMTDAFALAVGYQLRYNTKPGPRAFGDGDYAHSDRLLTLNLVYEFK